MIVAVNKVGSIGLNGGLPWGHNKEDLRQFRRKTLNNVIIIGRTTFAALPMVFDNRITCVMTTAEATDRNAMFREWHEKKLAKIAKCKTPVEAAEMQERTKLVFAGSVGEALEYADLEMKNPMHPNRRVFVGGGDKVYNAFIDAVGIVHMTVINDVTPGDTKLTVDFRKAGFYQSSQEESQDKSCDFVRFDYTGRLLNDKLGEPYTGDVENLLG
jgi:dihydrofolate reductase